MIIIARLAAFGAIALVIALTIGPVGAREMSPVAPVWDRSVAYAVIGFLLMLSFPRHPWRVVLGMLVMIVGLEVAQEVLPGRHARIVDVVEKSVGAGLGAAVAAGALWAVRRRQDLK